MNVSSGRTGVGFNQLRWDAYDWSGTTNYWQDNYPDDNHAAYSLLKVLDANGDPQARIIYAAHVYTDGAAQNSVSTSNCYFTV